MDEIVAAGDATIASRGLDKAAHWWWTNRSGAREIVGSLAAGEPFGLRVLDRSGAIVQHRAAAW